MNAGKHIPRVYIDDVLQTGQQLTLPDAKHHHLITVLRATTDDRLIIFNGDGHEYHAILTTADRKRATAEIQSVTTPERESPLQITLLQAIARGDRMDLALGKAVELGVSTIQPVFTARGQVKLEGKRLAKKQAHWQAILTSAAEQSGRLTVPTLLPPARVASWLDAPPADQACIMLDPSAGSALASLAPARHVTLLIGPESGLGSEEIKRGTQAGWQPVRLGPRVLRTETAGMATLAALQTCWGDLGRNASGTDSGYSTKV